MNMEDRPRRRSAQRQSGVNKALALVETQAPRLRTVQSGGQQVVIVLGMHRSGTRLVSNILHYLGVDMADESDHVSRNNPSGFWERPEIVALHDEVLDAIGRPVASPLHSVPFPPGWWRGKKLQPIKTRLVEHVAQQLAHHSGWWGFKDPRTCRLLPLWSEIFEILDVLPHYVWVVRSPGESAASMAAKNPVARPMSTAQAEVTWLAYNYDIMRHLMGEQPVVIEYGEWFLDPLVPARRLRDRLGVPGFAFEQDFVDCVRNIVSAEFRHQEEGRGQAISSIPLAQSLFREIVELAGTNAGIPSDRLGRFITILDVVFRALQPFAELVVELGALREARNDAEKRMAELGKQISQLDVRMAKAVAQKDALEAEVLKNKHQLSEARNDAVRQAAAHKEAHARLEGVLLKEKERATRLDAYVAALTSEHRADRDSDTRRIAELQASHQSELKRATELETRLAQAASERTELRNALAKSEAVRKELDLACQGYLSRIDSLKVRKRFPIFK